MYDNGFVEIGLLYVCTGETSIWTRSSYRETVSTLHCALENVLDLHVNECQKIRHYRARSTEERRMPNCNFFKLRGAYVNYAIIAVIH